MTGFKNFLMRGDVIVTAVGLVVALAFSGLILAFTTNIITPIVNRLQGGKSIGLGIQLGTAGNTKTFINIGAFISAIIYFIIFIAVVYWVIVDPVQAGPGPPGAAGVRRARADQDLPGLPVQRPPRRSEQVQVLRHRPAAGRGLTAPPRRGRAPAAWPRPRGLTAARAPGTARSAHFASA